LTPGIEAVWFQATEETKINQTDQNRQCGGRFHDEAAQAITDPDRRQVDENLVRAVQNRGDKRVPKATGHEQS
jgi:hypothetical protein